MRCSALAASSRFSMANASSGEKKSRLLPHVGGGIAGRVAAETFKSPFDLLKVRLQYDTGLKSRPLPVALFTVVRQDGMQVHHAQAHLKFPAVGLLCTLAAVSR